MFVFRKGDELRNVLEDVPEHILEIFEREDLVDDFEDYLRSRKFNDRALKLVYQWIENSNQTDFELGLVMDYTVHATTYEQVGLILEIIETLLEYTGIDIYEVLDLMVYDENGNVRPVEHLGKLLDVFLESDFSDIFELEEMRESIKYLSYDYRTFTLISYLIHCDVPDDIISKIIRTNDMDTVSEENIHLIGDLYFERTLTDKMMSKLINRLSLDPDEFEEVVNSVISKYSY